MTKCIGMWWISLSANLFSLIHLTQKVCSIARTMMEARVIIVLLMQRMRQT